ncbi:MAG: response regulator [Anaerolineales bacterium]|nr:response regulator [Anaerolineales bacterium]
MHFTLYAPTLLISACSLIAVALYALRRRDVAGSPTYGGVLLVAGGWALLEAFETVVDGVAAKLWLHGATWLCLMSVNVLNLRFLVIYLRPGQARPAWLGLTWLVPAAAILTLATNAWHGLFFTGFTLVDPPGVLTLIPGPGLLIAVAYSIGLGVVNAGWLARRTLQGDRAEQPRLALLLAAMVAPAPWILAYWLRWTSVDFTPASFVVVAALVAVAIYRYRLFDLMPIARELLLRNLTEGVLVLDGGQRVVTANPAWERLFGGPGPTPGQPAAEALRAFPALLDALPHPAQSIALQVDADPPRLIEAQPSQVCDAHGVPLGILVVARDITQRASAATVIAEKEKSLALASARQRFERELKAALAQVLRYVRGQIVVASDLIARGEIAPASALLARLDAIVSDTDHDVLSRFADSDGAAPQEDFYLALRQYVREFGQVSDVYVALSLPEHTTSISLLPVVQAQMMRIIQEALNNIRDHSQARTAQVIFARDGDEVQVTIADDGRGFDPQNVAPGGLTGIHERAAAIGGRAQIESVPGQGATVRVRVPTTMPQAGHGPLTGLRVVLADQEVVLLEALSHLLAAHGVDVVGQARDGRSLISLVDAGRPDLAIFDLHLPEVSSAEAAAQIKAQHPEVRCVILTASLDQAEVTRVLQSGVAGFLQKTQSTAELLESLLRLQHGERVFAPEVARRLSDMAVNGGGEDLSDRLSAQQADILRMVAEGLTYKEVGARMHITERTVRYHMEQILDALGLASRSKAIAFAYRVGLARDRRLAPRPGSAGPSSAA